MMSILYEHFISTFICKMSIYAQYLVVSIKKTNIIISQMLFFIVKEITVETEIIRMCCLML